MTRHNHFLRPSGLTFVLACLLALSHGSVFAQAPAAAGRDSKLDSPFASFRIGVVASPVASIDGGLDVTFPRLRLGPAWASRVDIDVSARFRSRSFGSRRDADVDLNFCQVYTPGGINRGRYFFGAGLGESVGPRSGLSGKLFAGINFTPVFSLTGEAQFLPQSPVRAVLMLRLAAL